MCNGRYTEIHSAIDTQFTMSHFRINFHRCDARCVKGVYAFDSLIAQCPFRTFRHPCKCGPPCARSTLSPTATAEPNACFNFAVVKYVAGVEPDRRELYPSDNDDVAVRVVLSNAKNLSREHELS